MTGSRGHKEEYRGRQKVRPKKKDAAFEQYDYEGISETQPFSMGQSWTHFPGTVFFTFW